MGGGSVEIAMAARGFTVRGYDLFEPVANFWMQTLLDASAVADGAQRYLPLGREEFYELQRTTSFRSPVEGATAYFVLNRSSFSGTTMSGGFSGTRFNAASVERLRNFRAPNLMVACANWRESLDANASAFAFIDPPYPIRSGLYGDRGNLQHFDHEALRDALRCRGSWLVTYNDCLLVRELYRDFRMVPLQWSYGMSRDKRGRELLIVADDVQEPVSA